MNGMAPNYNRRTVRMTCHYSFFLGLPSCKGFRVFEVFRQRNYAQLHRIAFLIVCSQTHRSSLSHPFVPNWPLSVSGRRWRRNVRRFSNLSSAIAIMFSQCVERSVFSSVFNSHAKTLLLNPMLYRDYSFDP